MKVTVFGGSGLLGSDIVKVSKDEYDIRSLSSSDVDVKNLDAVYKHLKIDRPDVVVNSAAIADVDKCENEPDNAFLVNAIGPKNLAIACRDLNLKLIHISTDYVFDGEKNAPYTEFDKPNPVNVYGESKLASEEFVKDIALDYVIIRTAWIFGERRRHFVDYVVNSIKEKDEIIAVKDMVSSPTYSFDLANMIKEFFKKRQTGTFHVANKGYCSRVEMVEEIMKIVRGQTQVKVLNQSQWERPAKRPKFSALRNYHMGLMDCDSMAGWRDALKRYIKYKYES